MAEEENDELLSFSEILDADDIQYEVVDVPEWGGKIRIGSLSAGEVLEFIELNDGPAKNTAGIRLLNRSLVDKAGKRIGEDKSLGELKKKDHRVVNRIIGQILKLNGMDKKAAEEAKNDSSEAALAASPTA
jgi:hypothetical protein